MPRGKKKASGGRRGEAGRAPGSDEDGGGNTPDDMSVASAMSDGSVAPIAEVEENGEVDESSSVELFEDKLRDVIDMTTQKSANGRTQALTSLRGALSKKYIPDFVIDRKVTICDAVERCMKKGRGEEQAQAAHCGVLVLCQLGVGSDSDDLYKDLRPVMTTIMADKSMPIVARRACAESLGLGSFIAGGELEVVIDVMKSLENIFKASYLKGDKSAPTLGPELSRLHTSALNAWCLLLSIAPTSVAQGFVDSHLSKLPELLTSTDVDLRIAAGEAIALMYELAREDDEDFEGDDIDELCATLKELATDSNKHRAKKDRRTQRSSFRDILHTVEDGDMPQERIKLGIETLELDSWVRKRQYDSFCNCMLSGTSIQLQENELLRDIFGLGAVIHQDVKITSKASKSQRHMVNNAAFKARTKSRGKNRDKRTAAFND